VFCIVAEPAILPFLFLLQVHLHEQFGNVFVDSCGGVVEAWVNPAAPVTLQVAAGGGIALDPALRVSTPANAHSRRSAQLVQQTSSRAASCLLSGQLACLYRFRSGY
jgi:hypothetical protein